MTVKELKKRLESCDDNAEVILQKDSEGNGYSPLYDIDDEAVYIENNTWSGDVYSTRWSHLDAGEDEEGWKAILEKPRCVVLAPIN